MALLYLAGELFNQVGRGPNAVTSAGGTVDSNFPLANLYDGRPRQPFSFSSTGDPMRAPVVDSQLLTNGDFEDSPLAGWTESVSGTGATAEETTTVNSGTYSLKCNAGTGTAVRFRDFTVRSNERLKFQGYLYGDGGANAQVRLLNRHTGKYWNGSSWTSSASAAVSRSTASWGQETTEFQIENRADCGGRNTVTLRVECRSTASGDVFFDDLEIVPAINFLGVFGHNVPPLVTFFWRSDADGNFAAGATNRAQFNAANDGIPGMPNFYKYLSTAVYERYWDLAVSGTPLESPRYGEVVMGYAESATKKQRPGWTSDYELPQARVETPERDQHVASRGSHPVRNVRLSFAHTSLAQRDEVRDEILARTDYGRLPMVIVPASDESDVIFGRVQSTWGVTRVFNAKYLTSSLVIAEDPHMEWIDG